jgi:hypothetical protein
MCLACEMDQLWMLYQEQQARTANHPPAAGTKPVVAPSSTLSAPESGKPAPTMICEEPTGE